MNAPPHETRNFLSLFADMLLYGVALSIIDPSTIIPAFVGKLTTNNGIIGLASSLFYVVWLFPQLLAARLVSRAPARKIWVFWPGLFARSLFLFLGLGIFFVGADAPQILLWGFILACTTARGIEGIVATAWSDLLGSSLQSRSRSRVLGYAQVVQGPLIIAIVGVSSPA
ncbi:MAG: hypothetical protein H6727_09130 [Myxococcales bacterium]|nr:hypothetical protein [Myxococcales bacterium]